MNLLPARGALCNAHLQLLETPEKKRMHLALKEKAQSVFREVFLFTWAHLETPQP